MGIESMHHIKYLFFPGILITLLYYLTSENVFMLFGNTLDGYFIAFPQTKGQRMIYTYIIFCQILILPGYSIIKAYQISVFTGELITSSYPLGG